MVTGRGGVTLPELILTAWLFALVLVATARFATAQGRILALSHERIRAADVARTADLILNQELRHASPADLTLTTDSVRLRAVRGVGVVCGAVGAERRVRYEGVRRPDPTKDSAVVVTGSSTDGTRHAVTGVVGDDGCGDYRLALSPAPVAPSGLVLVFETGSYHLSGGALRYRRGRGGRQPVTEALLTRSGFEYRAGRVALRLELAADSLPRLSRRWPTAGVQLLNRPVEPGPP